MDLALIGTIAGILAVLLAVPAFIDGINKMMRALRKRTTTKIPSQKALEQVQTNKTLIIGCVNFPPFVSFERAAGRESFGGIYTDVISEVGAQLGISIVPIAIRASQIFPSLTERRVHAVLCVIQSPARAKMGDFVSLKFGVPVIGVVKKGTKADWNSARLGDPTIRMAVVTGEVGEEIATSRYGASVSNGRLIAFDTEDVPSLFSQIAIGLADIAITTGPRWLTYSEQANPVLLDQVETIFVDKPLMLVPCGMIVPSGNDSFRDWLESECEKIWRTDIVAKKRSSIIEKFSPYITDL